MRCPNCELEHGSAIECSQAVANFLEKQAVELMDAVGRPLLIDRTPGDWPKPNNFRLRVELNVARAKQLKKRSLSTADSELSDYKAAMTTLEEALLGRSNGHLNASARAQALLQAMALQRRN